MRAKKLGKPIEKIAPQRGMKAILTLADFNDDQIFSELRRRGYTGELRFAKTYTL